METGRRSLIQPMLQGRMALVPLGVICEGGKGHTDRLLPWKPALHAGRSTGTAEGLKGPGLCSQECVPAGLLAIRAE